MQRIPVLLFLMLLIAAAFSRCAQIVAPTGGPKDTLPPVLVAIDPPDSSLHFNSKKITLGFDEFVQLQNLQQELIVTPYPKRQPTITSKLRTVTIQIKDTLQPNTTYTINLGSAVQDINENNPLKNLRYVFSTGDYLDSLQISGTLYDAETGDTDSSALIMLYTNLEDSVVTKEKPLYYARSAAGGKFHIGNLPHGRFKLFALKDANGDLQYDDSTEAIAFISDSLQLDSNLDNVDLRLFTEKVAAPPIDSSELKDTLTFKTSLSSGKQDLHQPLVLQFSRRLQAFDSSKITLEEDTARSVVHPVFSLDSTRKQLSLTYKWKEETPYRLLLQPDFATDTGGLKIPKADTLSFTTKGASDYGTLILHFTQYDSAQHVVVELVQNDKVVSSLPLQGKTWKIENLTPGDYSVRLLLDRNGNGKWDGGQYYGEKRLPEIVVPIEQKFNVRANWDNDIQPALEWKMP